jgi:hypothetical protein
MAKQLDAKLAAYWLSEAWGEDIPQSRVRVRKGWLFVRYPDYIDDRASISDPTWDGMGYRQIRKGWEKEVDCVVAPIPCPAEAGMVTSDNLSGEPWDCIKYQDSPFIPHNHSRVNEMIDELNEGYGDYMKELGLLSDEEDE